MDSETPPILVREDDSLEYTQPNGKTRNVGYHIWDVTTQKKGFLRYSPLFRIHNSYALTMDLLELMDDDIELIYVIDNDTRELYRFTVRDFVVGPAIKDNRQNQYAAPADEHRGCWKKGDQFVYTTDEYDGDLPDDIDL